MSFNNAQKARMAGVLYLLVVLTGIFSLMYVPSRLINWNDADITITNIRNSDWLFRAGIISGLACYICFLLLPVALYYLLKPVHPFMAKLMLLLAVISVPVSFINMQHKLAVLTLINNPALSNGSLASQVLFELEQYDNGILMVQLFWGLWLFPFGYLVFKSGILPRFLGILLMLGCFSYLINFSGQLLISNYSDGGIAAYVRLPASLGEIGSCLWLLIAGAKEYDQERMV